MTFQLANWAVTDCKAYMNQQFSTTYVILDSMPELGVPIYSPSVRAQQQLLFQFEA